jgi:hypothetical protein
LKRGLELPKGELERGIVEGNGGAERVGGEEPDELVCLPLARILISGSADVSNCQVRGIYGLCGDCCRGVAVDQDDTALMW